jgi:hypothetical protein
MKRKPATTARFNTAPLRRVLVRFTERPAVETAIEQVRIRLAPTVAKVHDWCSQPARSAPKKKSRRSEPESAT